MFYSYLSKMGGAAEVRGQDHPYPELGARTGAGARGRAGLGAGL